ncbi:hypothetical protein [Shewanella surugensis]|uniref:Uncharacterized protein n=1 Tax=Shewanella surugensis TaxID=212020 RepID=A0ABT0LG73_9GAMM|nr:hypothetical protein [Shewanella surugensis]MCL1126707.1 hypothetical protein [Shewanella surugensis]
MRLSLDLGCTKNELLNRLSSSEITEYFAYYKLQQTECPLSKSQPIPESPTISIQDEIAAMREELN